MRCCSVSARWQAMDSVGIGMRLLGIAIVLGAFYAVFAVFLSYGDRGESYPPYSTLRADPLGTSAIYGALERIEGLDVRRNQMPLTAYEAPEGATMVLAGAQVSADPEAVIERIEAWVARGGRLVITHATPPRSPWNVFAEEPDIAEEGEGEEEGAFYVQAPEGEEENLDDFVDGYAAWVDDRWGFDYEHDRDFSGPGRAYRRAADSALPEYITWGSELYFDAPADAWTVLYERDGLPVLMERAWEAGTIVMAGDTYFLSNEAMKEERHPALLSWMVGDADTVVFDETHLGVVDAPGMADLIRRFRMEGILLVFVVCGLLLVWSGASSLLPKHDRMEGTESTSERGREAMAGLEELLRRSVSKRELLSTCLAEYERTLDPASPRRKRLDRARDLVRHAEAQSLSDEEIVNTYRQVSAILAEKH